jgi:hypothetical protein
MNYKEHLQKEYISAYTNHSDINDHVQYLHELAKECDSVVELGVRTGVSTRAFLVLDVKLRSYDIYIDDDVEKLFVISRNLGHDHEYILGSSLEIDIDPADMMFVDTDHNYAQVTNELNRHASKIKKYIGFHDTQIFEHEVLRAVNDFLKKNKEWKIHYHTDNNNGLTVIKRT